jgi:hypothetical protein
MSFSECLGCDWVIESACYIIIAGVITICMHPVSSAHLTSKVPSTRPDCAIIPFESSKLYCVAQLFSSCHKLERVATSGISDSLWALLGGLRYVHTIADTAFIQKRQTEASGSTRHTQASARLQESSRQLCACNTRAICQGFCLLYNTFSLGALYCSCAIHNWVGLAAATTCLCAAALCLPAHAACGMQEVVCLVSHSCNICRPTY